MLICTTDTEFCTWEHKGLQVEPTARLLASAWISNPWNFTPTSPYIKVWQAVTRLLNKDCRQKNKLGVKFEISKTAEIHTVVFPAYDGMYFDKCLLTLRRNTRNTASTFKVNAGSIRGVVEK